MLRYYSGTSPKIHNCREGHKAVFNIFRCTEAHFSQSTCSLVLNDFNVFTEDRFSNNSQDIEYIPDFYAAILGSSKQTCYLCEGHTLPGTEY